MQETQETSLSSTDLAKIRTKLANQRTYLAYMRTGFGIAAIAGVFKKNYLFFFGIFMIIVSALIYFLIHWSIIRDRSHALIDWLDYTPLIYVILSLTVFYLQFHK